MPRDHKKREYELVRLQEQRGLYPGEVTELLDMRLGRARKNEDWEVQVGRLAFSSVAVDERIAAQKRDEDELSLERSRPQRR